MRDDNATAQPYAFGELCQFCGIRVFPSVADRYLQDSGKGQRDAFGMQCLEKLFGLRNVSGMSQRWLSFVSGIQR